MLMGTPAGAQYCGCSTDAIGVNIIYIFSCTTLWENSTDSLSRCLKGSSCPCSQNWVVGSTVTPLPSPNGDIAAFLKITVIHSSIKHAVSGVSESLRDPVDLVEWGTHAACSQQLRLCLGQFLSLPAGPWPYALGQEELMAA